jgi:hypothetical protein
MMTGLGWPTTWRPKAQLAGWRSYRLAVTLSAGFVFSVWNTTQ